MDFDDFIKNGIIRTSFKDTALAKSLLQNIKKDIKFLDSLKINENSARRLMVNYYDILRGVLESISAIDGYKIYSHEAFVYFLKKKGEELFSIKFDRFRKIRNSINYYGDDISIEETKDNIEKMKEMINILVKKYLGGLE